MLMKMCSLMSVNTFGSGALTVYNTIQYNTYKYEYYDSGINPGEFRGMKYVRLALSDFSFFSIDHV